MLHVHVSNDLAAEILRRGIAAGLYNERDEKRKFFFIIPNMASCTHVTNKHTPTHTPVHQRKSHSIKLLYPQESDSINEAYLWNQQSGKSYQGGARQRDEDEGGRKKRGGGRRACDELKVGEPCPTATTCQPCDEVTRCMLNHCHASLFCASLLIKACVHMLINTNSS